ncbi:hypothetical protein DFR85_08325 [Acidianus brierleyi]|uniref:GINS subunit domain-containing protein n=2 Tax=Acidianus brierleyi TaxID=41673 RepID=A0A2U9IF69_9CREN|nr:hypothetical protein DFR85_08325 [Acidianus brierleyi]
MFNTKLRAINRLFMVEKEKVIVLDDTGTIDLGFNEISLYKGSEDEIPFWLAKELEKSGKTKVNRPNIDEMGRILFQEKQNINTPASIIQLYNNFYIIIKFLINDLKNSSNIEDLERLRKVYAIIKELSSIRLRKIIQLALLNINEQTLISKMTKEEFLVYSTISEILRKYYGDIIGNSS